MISLTAEQRAPVVEDGNIYLSACPGSGKTRVITAKLLLLAEAQIGSPRSVACITYTNAAVDEIESRLKQVGSRAIIDCTEVCTIHSFCLQYVLRPYRWLAPDVPTTFKILTREAPEFERLVEAVEDEIGRRIGRTTYEDYASISMGLDGEPFGPGIERGLVSVPLAKRFWQFMRAAGFIDFSMILFYSHQILHNNDFVASGVASKFKWLLVDEFQDTSALQIEIFKIIFGHKKSGFFLVGDENQSIYGFAGAVPEAAQDFAKRIDASFDFALSGNFRSGPRIVDLAESLIPRNPRMNSVGAAAAYVEAPIYVHVGNPTLAVTDYFLPWVEIEGIPLGKCAVLAPWWTNLIPIARHLRDIGVPVFGPGARPYQRRRTFATLAEQLGACVEQEHLLGLPGVEKAIFRLAQEVVGVTRFDVFSYEGRKSALSLVYEAKRVALEHSGGLDWLRTCATQCADILVRDGWLLESQRALLRQSVDEMEADMARNRIDTANLQISDLGLFANPDRAIKLITLHNSKGREFDAVAVICLNEGRVPHFSAETQEEFDEARRLFYVGISRTRKLLLLASDQSHWRDRPSRFIAETGIARSN
ncbi:ATP-dependent helicase [Mesorhizobium salmacidum]|uniref:DNA 3'-5' helicase n=1 Tax=Mesorhizobium salmacidum TaxID=3015171 RepID=A0ABU8KQB1_9HYPH